VTQPRRDLPRRVTPELIAFHKRRAKQAPYRSLPEHVARIMGITDKDRPAALTSIRPARQC